MPSLNKHIIQKQVLEVEMENPADAFQFKNRLGEVFHEKILPALEVLFDEIGAFNRLIRIDELEIDVGNISSKRWEQELVEKAIIKTRQLLLLQNPVWEKAATPIAEIAEKNALIQTKQKNDLPYIKKQQEELTPDIFIDTFFFYLKTGRLPWFAQGKINFKEQLNKWILEEPETLKAYLKKADLNELIRLLYQSDEPLLNELVKILLSKSRNVFYTEFIKAKNILSKLFKSLLINPAIIKNSLYLPFFKWLSFEDEADPNFFYPNELAEILFTEHSSVYKQPLFKKFIETKIDTENNTLLHNIIERISTAPLIKVPQKDKSLTQEKPGNLTEQLYVENSGLILLHPFLPPFFTHLELTIKDQFIDDYARMKAVLLTQYLVTGIEITEEHQLVLNKIICGFPLDAPIIKELIISKKDKDEAADLLQQVIQLWKKNNVQVNSTIEGLQNSFLQRHGKLMQKDKDWQLQVEQKPYDMVLSSLPWGIGIIKNPWMHGMLWVDWT